MISIVRVIILVLVCISIIVYTSLYDYISCQVTSDSNSNDVIDKVKGYYSAYNGQYIKRGPEFLSYIPDFFELYSIHRDYKSLSIINNKSQWYLYDINTKHTIYMNDNNIIEHPPLTNWKLVSSNSSNLIVKNCHGSITNSYPIKSYNELSNIQIMLQQPITMLLLFIIYYYAYYLYTQNIDVSNISFSYDGIIGNKEYWRVITSSFAHVDLLHLAFNTMTLYDIGNHSIYIDDNYLILY